MSVYIDRTFLLRVSPRLQKFSQKKQDLYNFRCPICGDSQKNKTKCRGYIYRKKNDYFYMCHNCGISTTFYNFLEKVDPSILSEYALERYKNGEDGNHNYKKPKLNEFKTEKPVFKKSLGIDSIQSLDKDHFAKKYCLDRKLPKKSLSELYFAPDFKKFVESMGVEKDNLKENDPRLIIPFYDKDKNLIAFQGRALEKSNIRYITIKLEDDTRKFFGADRIDEKEMIYIVEGPLDSLFLDNSVATADSNLESSTQLYDKDKIALVFDNEPRNKEIVKLMDHAIENHFNIVIWPEFIQEKDINEMVLGGFDMDELKDIIHKNTFVNLRAKFEFVNWKKV